MIGPPADDRAALLYRAGAEHALATLSYLTFRNVSPADGAIGSLESAVSGALQDRPDALLVYADDLAILEAACALAKPSHTPIFAFGPELGDAPVAGAVIIDYTAGAELLAKSFPDLIGDKQSFVLAHRAAAGKWWAAVVDRFNTGMPRHAGARRLAERDAAATGESTEAAVMHLLNDYRSAGVVVTLDPFAWSSPTRVLPAPQRHRLLTLGATPDLWPLLRAGEITALVGPNHAVVGARVAKMASEWLLNPGSTLDFDKVGCEIITAADLPDFAARCAAAAGLALTDIATP